MCVCVCVCVCEGERERVCAGRKKKNEQTWFSKEKGALGQEREKISSKGKFLNLKVLKFWLLIGKVSSHF